MIVTTSDGARLRVEVEGEGPPVLLVHGFPLSGALWEGTVARLRDRYRLVVPDLRGHGGSGASPVASMARYAADLEEVLDAVGAAGPVAVVGLSLGGYVAMELLRRSPERVGALALVDTRAGPDGDEAARGREETAQRVLREGSGALVGMVERLFSPAAPEALRERWREVIAATPPEGAAAALRAMAARPDSTATLAAAAVPLLVVVGADDAITPVEEARRMAEGTPGARLEVVEGAGHMTPAERPGPFSSILAAFLDGAG